MDIPIELISDEKGYFDRECPNENCLYTFKIKMQDWKDKVSDEEVHCPMCGHIDTSEKWWTQAQLDSASKIASDYVMDMISGELDKIFGRLARSTRGNKFVKITYKPGKRISFSNNPIGQSEEWETEIECEKCGTRYSVIGSAYFCPCCGNNSAISVFDESLDSIEKMLESLGEMKELLTNSYGRDKAETMSRSLLESSLGDVVSAFQKFAECVYKQKSSEKVRVNDFQIVEKGSNLFLDATGKGYDEWLTKQEIERMNLLFQRRHIIEHNAGIVDKKYLEKSLDTTYVIGQRIIVRKEDAQELLRIIKKLSMGLKSL